MSVSRRPRVTRLPGARYGLEGRAPPMSRTLSVCLCAVMTFVAVFGVRLLSPVAVYAATGTLSMETPLHDAPSAGAPLIALVPAGAVVSIDGPPVDGFYPVSTAELSGWMRGETMQLQKDIVDPEADAATPDAGADQAPVAQTAEGEQSWTEPAATDAAATTTPADPPPGDQTSAPADGANAAPPVDASTPSSTAPAPAATDAVPAVPDAVPAATDPAATDPSLPGSATAFPSTADAPPVDPTLAPTAEAIAPEPAATNTTPAATPIPLEPAPAATDEAPPADATAAPALTAEPDVTPMPQPTPGPTGPATVTTDTAIRTGPGRDYDLIFSAPRGSTVEQTGQVVDGWVTVHYKEISGWAPLAELAEPLTFEAETPEAAEPVDTKTPRAGSGVAFTTVDLSLRAGPSATEEPVAAVPAGSRVILTGVMEGGFQRVTYDDQIGWIADEFLQSPEDPGPDARGKGKTQDYAERQVVRYIYQAADRYGQSREDMLRVARCESNLDPYAVNPSGSYGLFQFIRSTWKSTPYGDKNIFDPQANANAAGWMWAQGRKSEWVCQ